MEFSSGSISRPEEQIDIARSIKTIDWLKTEIVGSVATLFRGMMRNNLEVMAEALANLIVGAYLLGNRLGIGFSVLDAKVERKVKANIDRGHEIEKWYGDFSSFLSHLRGRKR